MKTIQISATKTIAVYPEDLDGVFSWDQIKQYIQNQNNGWRLPSRYEIQKIFDCKDDLNFANYGYWSYWTAEENGSEAYCLCGPDKKILSSDKNDEYYIRLVRDFDEIVVEQINHPKNKHCD